MRRQRFFSDTVRADDNAPMETEFFSGLVDTKVRKNISFISPVRGELTMSTSYAKSERLTSSDEKSYPLFVVPPLSEEVSEICFRMIGSGITICINKNCTQKRQGGACPIIPGEAYVQRDKNRVFSVPSIDFDLVDKP